LFSMRLSWFYDSGREFWQVNSGSVFKSFLIIFFFNSPQYLVVLPTKFFCQSKINTLSVEILPTNSPMECFCWYTVRRWFHYLSLILSRKKIKKQWFYKHLGSFIQAEKEHNSILDLIKKQNLILVIQLKSMTQTLIKVETHVGTKNYASYVRRKVVNS